MVIILQTCAICEKKFADLRSHLRKHKVTWQEYRDIYNVIPLSLSKPFTDNPEAKKNKMLNAYEIEKYIERKEYYRKKNIRQGM